MEGDQRDKSRTERDRNEKSIAAYWNFVIKSCGNKQGTALLTWMNSPQKRIKTKLLV